VQQWNFTIEQRVGEYSTLRLAYVGSHGVHLSAVSRDGNLVEPQILPDGRRFFPEDGEKVNPHFSTIVNRPFNAHSFYHGLQARFHRRLRRGLSGQLSYTHSKSIDDSSSFFYTTEADNAVMLPLPDDARFNRGLSGHDVRHAIVASGLWEIPSPQTPSLGYLADGWELGAIVSYASGLPLTARLGYDAARTKTAVPDRRSGQRPDLAPGASNNPVTGDPNGWVDLSAFRRPVPGFLGNLGRNTIIGPDLFSVDVSAVKRFSLGKLREGASLDIRVECFNVLNRTNFHLPTAQRMEVFSESGSRGDVGRITSADESREFQLGLKIRF
jgi:hypothetical protein